MTESVLVCEGCGESFLTTRRGKVFCSRSCGWRHNSRLKYAARKAAGVCAKCARVPALPDRVYCLECGQEAAARVRASAVKRAAKRKSLRLHRDVVCLVCGDLITDARHRQKYCSPACRNKRRRATVNAPTPEQREASRIQEAARRARRGRVYDSQWLSLRRQVLAEEATCHICGDEIDPTLKWPHPRSGTADHVLPLSKGGARLDRDNVHAAHFWCNNSKGAQLAAG